LGWGITSSHPICKNVCAHLHVRCICIFNKFSFNFVTAVKITGEF
jgi:hypothetical protein